MPRGRAWTSAEVAQLEAALAENPRPRVGELARALGRTESAISERLHKIRSSRGEVVKPARYQHVHGQGQTRTWERRCLSCRGGFHASSPYVRVCQSCKATDAWRAGA